jgi:hypothetical protein
VWREEEGEEELEFVPNITEFRLKLPS